MSKEQRRDDLGKLLACLLVSRKGTSTIKDLEKDYYENEGRRIPYHEFDNLSSLDFFRSISNHVKIIPSCGTYVLHPVVSEKIKHVNDLVCRQKSPKKHTPFRHRSNRPSQFFPSVRQPKSFVPNHVQKQVARIVTSTPSGVSKSCIAQCLQNSNALPDTVDLDNVDDYVNSMPYTAVANGNMVYPSRSLNSNNNTPLRYKPQDNNDSEIVMQSTSETCRASIRNINSQLCDIHHADYDEVEISFDDQVAGKDMQWPLLNLDDNTNRHQRLSKNEPDSKSRKSSAKFNDHAGFQQRQSQQMNYVERHQNDVRVDQDEDNLEDQNGDHLNEDCTFVSDDESIDIINSKMKSRLQQLIQKYPEGIWCADLPQAYLEEYKVGLDYVELGFGGVCEFIAHLPSIFHMTRSNRGDFMLYDATKPLPHSAINNKPGSPALSDDWQNECDDKDIDPFPMTLPIQMSQRLVPNDVMSYGESVGQQRIPELSAGSECLEIYVAEVYTPSLFWIQLRSKRPQLNQLMESLHDFYQREGDNYIIPHVILEKGLNCVCIFGNKWHRAIIKTVKPDGDVTLIFYDYGTTRTYPPDSLRFLNRQYSNLPAQAIACGLYNLKPINSDKWTRGVSTEFYNKVEGLPLIAIVVKVDKENNSMLVSLVDTQGDVDEHINDWLVHQQFAELGFMGDSVTLEYEYLDDQISQPQDATVNAKDVPLVSPQSTLHKSSKNTIKLPSGFTKPLYATEYAAVTDAYFHGRSYNTTDMENSTSLNAGGVDVNNRPSVLHNTTYNPVALEPETIMQFWQSRLEMNIKLAAAISQFFLTNSNADMVSNTTVDNPHTVLPAMSVNPIEQQSKSNPSQLHQENNGQEFSTITNNLKGHFDRSINPDMNKSNNFCVHNSRMLPHSERQPSSTSKDCNPLDFGKQNLLSRKPTSSMTQDDCRSSNLNNTLQGISSFGTGYMKQIFPDTQTTNLNDHKNEHLVATDILHQQDEMIFKPTKIGNPTFRTDKNIFAVPRKDDSTEETFSNDTQCEKIEVNISADVVNEEEFTAQQLHDTNPFKQHIIQALTNKVESRRKQSLNTNFEYNDDIKPPIPPRNINFINKNGNITTKYSTDMKHTTSPVFNDQQDIPTSKIYYQADPVMYNSKINEINEKDNKLDKETPELTVTASFQGKHHDIIESSQDFTNRSIINDTSYNFRKANFAQTDSNSFLSGVDSQPSTAEIHTIFTPSNDNNLSEYQFIKKSPISPRFTSPLLSENSKAIKEVQSAPKFNFIDSFKPVEISTPTTRDEILKNFDTYEKDASSSTVINNNTIFATTSDWTLYSRSAARPDNSYKINLILPKSLPDQRNTVNLEQELPNTVQKIEVISKASGIIPGVAKIRQDSVKQKENPSSIETQTDDRESVQACESVDTSERKNDCNTSLALNDLQALINEQHLLYKDCDKSRITSKADIRTDNNHMKSPKSESRSTVPNNILDPYQPQPLNATQHFSSQYQHIGHLPHQPNYPYPKHQGNLMQQPQVNQGLPLLRPTVHGVYPPKPYWSERPFSNPELPYAYLNFSHSCHWNPHNSHMFVPQQAAYARYGSAPCSSKRSSKIDCNKTTVSSRLDKARALAKQTPKNITTHQNKEIRITVPESTKCTTDQLSDSGLTNSVPCNIPETLTNFHSDVASNSDDLILSTQLNGLNLRPGENRVRKVVTEDTTSTKESKCAQILPVIPPRNNSEQSTNENIKKVSNHIPPQLITNVLKLVEANEQTIHLFNIENQGWACTDELVQVFTHYTNRHGVLRILELMNLEIKFKKVSRAESPLLFSELDGTTLLAPRLSESGKIKDPLHLTPLNSLLQMMISLKVISTEEVARSARLKKAIPGSKLDQLVKFINSYRCDDKYWMA